MNAALGLLRDKTLRSLTIEEIAERAGVGKTTIYNWWPSKAFVVLDAFLSRMQQDIPTQDTGSAGRDFLLQLQALINFSGSPLGRTFAC